MSYQSITIVGNLGAPPEQRTTQNGKSVCTFSVAVNEKRGNESTTEWFRCVAWEKTAEVAMKFLQKGHEVLVVGRLKTNKWKDQQGQEHTTIEVQVNHIGLLHNGGGSAQQQPAGYGQPGYGAPQGYTQPQPAGYGAPPPGYPPQHGYAAPPAYAPPANYYPPGPPPTPAPPAAPAAQSWGGAAPAQPAGLSEEDIPF